MKRKRRSKKPLALIAEEALKEAVREALRDHVRTGDPVVVFRKGKVMTLPAEKIKRSLKLR